MGGVFRVGNGEWNHKEVHDWDWDGACGCVRYIPKWRVWEELDAYLRSQSIYMGSLWVVGERAGMISKHVLVCCLGKGKHQKMLQQRDLVQRHWRIDPSAM